MKIKAMYYGFYDICIGKVDENNIIKARKTKNESVL